MTQKKNESQATGLQVLQYHNENISFKTINGNVMANATQMAKAFGKQPIDWLKTQQSKDLLKAISKVRKISLADLQRVVKGGTPGENGTWFHEDVALLFAQWLSPEFYVACNMKLKELLTKQALLMPLKHGVNPVLVDGKLLYSYKEAMRVFGGSIRSSASRRKKKHPEHFIVAFGRNFVTESYLSLLNSFYAYRKAQLSLFDGGC